MTGVQTCALPICLNLGLKLSSTNSGFTNYSASYSEASLITPVELGFDWKFMPNQLAYLNYETGTTLATGSGTAQNLSTSNVLTIGYGYAFLLIEPLRAREPSLAPLFQQLLFKSRKTSLETGTSKHNT